MAKYKVAVATNDGVNVNVHFGHAAAFDIYEVDEAMVLAETALVDSAKFSIHRCMQQPRI